MASAWCSKELNMAGNNLTHVNFVNTNNEIKLIASLKFYQRSWPELSSTLTEQEKIAVKSLAEKVLIEHYYFSTVWTSLSSGKKNRILEIISQGKGVIPYEIIVDMESFLLIQIKIFGKKQNFSVN